MFTDKLGGIELTHLQNIKIEENPKLFAINVMRQSACLVINPITVDDYATLFHCTPVDRASDSMMAPT